MKKENRSEKIILYTCNWHALHSLEGALKSPSSYPVDVFPLRVSCLGRISPGLILQAFQKGADGVFLIGCQEGDCRYQSGNHQAQKIVKETRKLIELLGIDGEKLQLIPVHAGEGETLIQDLQKYLGNIRELEVAE